MVKLSEIPVRYLNMMAKYPRLFPDPKSVRFELTKEGWSSILDDALDMIDQEVEFLPEELGEGIIVSQVKSKFGTLRIYLNQTTPYIRGVIGMAERASYLVCEVCGNKADSRTILGAVCTMCPTHLKEEEDKREEIFNQLMSPSK